MSTAAPSVCPMRGGSTLQHPHHPRTAHAQLAGWALAQVGRKSSSLICSEHLCSVRRHLHNNRIQRLGAKGFDGLHNLETL